MSMQNVRNLSDGMERILPSLTAAGIEIPAEVKEAFHNAKQVPPVVASHDANAARSRLLAAQTPEEVDQASRELADALLYKQITGPMVETPESQVFKNALEAQRYTATLTTVVKHADGWFAELSRRYNEEVPTFTAAASQIPDDVAAGPGMGLSRSMRTTISDAEESAGRLGVYWSAYSNLGRVLGYIDNPSREADPQEFEEQVLLLCEPWNWAHVIDASHAWKMWNWHPAGMPFAPLMPHMIGIRYADELKLVEHPLKVKDREDAVRERYFNAQGMENQKFRTPMMGTVVPAGTEIVNL